ncbi:tRNA pseudouridine(13) synthase TruD [Actinoplanes sp. NPDC051851]|uniref:tRNA pseudouridine(13) synthase TruD n=1 Tax=Actinoplanes sp. NPDC051851 TaxID=3154753 RepID=UPI003415068C
MTDLRIGDEMFDGITPLLTTERGPAASPPAPAIKWIDEDFLVKEAMVLDLRPRDGAEYRYLLLRKRGYTTMEAIRLVAGRLGLTTREVTYGGLKDEDGVTQQVVAVPVTAADAVGEGAVRVAAEGGARWIDLQHYGYGAVPLRIGALEGNAFRIVVRNLDEATAGALAEARKISHLFLNYYDTQRFGVPGQPKRTHLVGAAILEGRWSDALGQLRALGTPESGLAQQWRGSAADFFLSLDSRTVSFFLASTASKAWNDDLAAVLRENAPDDTLPVRIEDIPFAYARSGAAVAKVLAATAQLPYARYTFEDGEITEHASVRATVIQTQIAVSGLDTDDLFAGRHRVRLGLFLPSGVYATAAVRQLFALRSL